MTGRPGGKKSAAPGVSVPRQTFEEVITEHLEALYRTAVRMSHGHGADAEDLLQDAVLRACEAFHELRDHAAARAWLFTILMRTHLNRVRTIRRRREALESDLSQAEFERALAEWPLGLAEHNTGGWQQSEVSDSIDALDESLRSVVVLIDVEGFRQREAAVILDLPEGTVASRLFRARRQLRDALLGRSRRDANTGTRSERGR